MGVPAKRRAASVIDLVPVVDAPDIRQSVSFQQFRNEVAQTDATQIPFRRLVRKYGHSVTWVYISVNRIAHAVAQTRFRIIDRRKLGQPDNEVGADADELRNLLEQPNPLQSGYDFSETAMTSLELTGNLFIEKSPANRRGRPTSLHVLPPHLVLIRPDSKNLIGGYELETNGRNIEIPPGRVIRCVYDNPENPLFGLAPLTAAMNEVDFDVDAITWNRQFMRKGAWPAGVIQTKNKIAPAAVRRLEAQIKKHLASGKDTAGRMLLLTDGLEYVKIGVVPKDLDWLDGRRYSRDQILAIYGVPFAVAGLFSTEQTTARSAGVAQQVKNFYLFTIFPKVRKYLSALNRDLVPSFNPNWLLEPDFGSVPALQDDVEQEKIRADALYTLTKCGVPLNQALAHLYPRMQSVVGGDVPRVESTMVPMKIADLTPEEKNPPKPDAPSQNDDTEDEAASVSRIRAAFGDETASAYEALLTHTPLFAPQRHT